jgi:hypothetical protein
MAQAQHDAHRHQHEVREWRPSSLSDSPFFPQHSQTISTAGEIYAFQQTFFYLNIASDAVFQTESDRLLGREGEDVQEQDQMPRNLGDGRLSMSDIAASSKPISGGDFTGRKRWDFRSLASPIDP